MNNEITSILVVGGGTAGWLTAARIAAQHNASSAQSAINISLIESDNISPINVGEGTWPTMRDTLQAIGVSETDFIRHCRVSFKQGAQFINWVDNKPNDFYYHPLVLPLNFSTINLAPFWQRDPIQQQSSFSNAVCYQEALCQQGLAPKLITSPEYGALANYAYHLDSAKFSIFLKEHCTQNLGIKHIVDEVVNINSHDNGDIASVTTAKHADIAADLFIDCTGTRSLLLGQHYKVPFIKVDEVLFCDRALALQVPYDNENSEIASHTLSTAQDAGWIWDIGLPTRRGVGYVYSQNHQSEDQAIARLEQYVGDKFSDCTLRKIPINAGHHQVFWKNNCVAVGLSSGFLEPLEASSLVLVEMSAQMIAEQLPANRQTMTIVAKRFNETFSYRWQRIIDFLKLHYLLSKREEPFWQDNRQLSSVPESLQELMALWQHRSPADFDFSNHNEVFPAASYQYILYGMGFKTDYQQQMVHVTQEQLAKQQFDRNTKMTQQALGVLPKNRDLLNTIYKYGFQTA